jgi:tetratricopeptide (TPR) repeat protein
MNGRESIYFYLCLFLFQSLAAYAQTAESLLQHTHQLYERNYYDAAREKYIIALKQAEAENNPAVKARASLSLARCYYFLNDRTASFKWTYNALDVIEKHHLDTLLSRTFYFPGALYIEDGRVVSAEKYSFKAIEFFLKERNYSSLSQTYSTLAELHISTTKNIKKSKV